METQGSLVNVRFRCQACDCEVEVAARVFVSGSSRLYEYSSREQCSNCPHRLFGRHDAIGESWPEKHDAPPRGRSEPYLHRVERPQSTA